MVCVADAAAAVSVDAAAADLSDAVVMDGAVALVVAVLGVPPVSNTCTPT